MIAEILEIKGQRLTLRHASDTEIEPSPQILNSYMWKCVACDPYVKAVLDLAFRCSCHVATAEIGGEDDI